MMIVYFLDTNPFIPSLLNISFGVLLWTLIEYSLHRWVFHMEPSGDSKAMIYVHFAIHGLHHKVLINDEIDYKLIIN